MRSMIPDITRFIQHTIREYDQRKELNDLAKRADITRQRLIQIRDGSPDTFRLDKLQSFAWAVGTDLVGFIIAAREWATTNPGPDQVSVAAEVKRKALKLLMEQGAADWAIAAAEKIPATTQDAMDWVAIVSDIGRSGARPAAPLRLVHSSPPDEEPAEGPGAKTVRGKTTAARRHKKPKKDGNPRRGR
jgi:hypothetical protein